MPVVFSCYLYDHKGQRHGPKFSTVDAAWKYAVWLHVKTDDEALRAEWLHKIKRRKWTVKPHVVLKNNKTMYIYGVKQK